MAATVSDTSGETIRRPKIYTVQELFELPEPSWQIHKLFPVESFVVAYGASGHGKSFVALDWSLSIALGKDWFGRGVQRGTAVYVAGEGGRAIRKRVAAWMQFHDVASVQDAHFVLEGIQVRKGAEVDELMSLLLERDIRPTVIVLDTLARCFVGGDENSAQEMGEFVEGVRRLVRLTGATVIVVHHSGRNPDHERGSTALRAGADVMVSVSKDDENTLMVENKKQKDDEEFEMITLTLKQVRLAESDSTSCVLVPYLGRAGRKALQLTAAHRKTLAALRDASESTLATQEWQEKAGIGPERTIHNHRAALVRLDYVEEVQRGVYRVTDKGKAVLAGEEIPVVTGAAATAKRLQLVQGGSSPF